MSDVFNTPHARRTITQALGLTNVSDRTQDWLLPEPWNPPMDPIKNSQEAAEYLQRNQYRMLKPRAIPENTPLDTSELFPHLAEFVGSGAFGTSTLVPAGSTEYIPRYYPTHKPEHNKPTPFGHYDVALLKQMTYQLTNGKDNPEEEGTTFRQFRDTIVEQQYGSGTSQGQLARLVAMKEVATGRNPNKSPKELGLSMEEIATMLEQTLPIGQPGGDEGWPSLTTTLSELLNPAEGMDYLPHITMKSSSGLPFIGKTKGETVTSALAICDTFLREVSECVKEGAMASDNQKLQKLLQDYWYLSCGLLFPKAERYEKKAWLTKTRNIWSAPFPTHLLLSTISWPIMNSSKNNILNVPECVSLYGFNPFSGGMDAVVTNILAQPDETLFLIYADNIYIYMDRTWFSIDLEKGEANATPEHAQAVSYYLLTRGWTQDDGSPAFNATWATIAMMIAPSLVVDSSCLFMNLQLKTYGQGSGNAWTFLINHTLSTILVGKWIEAGQPNPRSKEFMDLEAATGINFKIEREIEGLPTRLQEAMDKAVHTGFLGDGTTNPPEKEGPTVDLDLLGWSATYSRHMDMWVPVLDKERLLSSAAYPKGLENKDLKGKPGAEIAYKIVRNEALLMVGGWNYPLIARSLMANTSAARNNLRQKGVPLDTLTRDWEKMTEFSDIFEDLPIDTKLEVTSEFLQRLNLRGERKQPNVNKHHLRTKGLKKCVSALKQGACRNPTTVAGLKLTAYSKSRINKAKAVFDEINNLPKTESDDWSDRMDDADRLMKANNLYMREARSALEDVHNSLLALSGETVKAKTPQEKSTEKVSNPVVGYRLPAERATGVQHALLGVGVSRPSEGALTKNARKMKKRREKARGINH
ncbi:RNA-dependent RNA polymerase [Blotched snakehead virus]|uniref:RNA-directed RNA polymerase n=3 Tax=Birnaviridae TaxID=10993 RepID=RDRP_BSNV|nr:RNA-dependent RNA polymerase [Blotched snakehead virus]Q8AZL8.1 RecName: Full=RNA-directed RNA polymerase; Short=RDRP; AltName: Full=Protein VP1 [Blotched snakehead virus]CAD30691.1 RNA-dependent RNA polymerase [Blotched snakehead virus]